MVGASKAYTGKKFSKQEPLHYFIAYKDTWKMNEESKKKITADVDRIRGARGTRRRGGT